MPLTIAAAPTSWGVEDPADAANPPWNQVLDEAAAAGYAGIELGPLGFLPDEPAFLRAELAARRLQLSGGFLFEPLQEPGAAATHIVNRTCALLAGGGARHLVIIQGFTPDREPHAGRRDRTRPLDARDWSQLVAAVEAIATRARTEHGLIPSFHPHAGTYVEYEDEIDRFMEASDPDLVKLCIDTGHSLYAGIDPVDLYRRYADRVAYLHLKDVDPDVLECALARGLGFEEAVARGVFCPIGHGAVDFDGLRAALQEHGYDGWATVEQDRLPGAPRSAFADACASLERLQAAGLAGAPR